jgi:deoxyribonuclease-4
MKYNIGAHLSIKKGYYSLFEQASCLDINYIQCFTASNRQLSLSKEYKNTVVEKFFETKKKHKEKFIYSHASYLINIASDDDDYRKKSEAALLAELYRCDVLEIIGSTVHVGSNKNINNGLENVFKSICSILDIFDGKAKIFIENSAGQGNTFPTTIDEISKLYNKFSIKDKSKVKLTIDTCHAHSAGYDFSDKKEQESFWSKINEEIGIESIGLIHLNDSKTKCGSFIDRHENITKGSIKKNGFKYLFENKHLKNIPKILETPYKTIDDYKKEIEIIKNI